MFLRHKNNNNNTYGRTIVEKKKSIYQLIHPVWTFRRQDVLGFNAGPFQDEHNDYTVSLVYRVNEELRDQINNTRVQGRSNDFWECGAN